MKKSDARVNPVKLSRKELNELLYYISKDNQVYGLVFKMMYIYGRSVGEILKLRVKDVDLKHNALDFILPVNRSKSFMIHDSVKTDLLTVIEDKGKEDLLFFEDKQSVNLKTVNNMSKKLNYYLSNIIKELNGSVLKWHCPVVVCGDFKKFRGQHLFLDGVGLSIINDLYCNQNMQSTRDMIDYNSLKSDSACRRIDCVFHKYTDLNIFHDIDFDRDFDLFTVSHINDEGVFVVCEYDYVTGVVGFLEGDVEWFDLLLDDEFNLFLDSFSVLDCGDYKWFNDVLLVVKN